MNLLIVEDDDDFRATATAWMERRGHRVAPSPDSRSALELARKQQFDVAILDLNLPDLSGLELMHQLLQFADEIEIIMLTGAASVETAVEAMKRGACDYLSKPFPLAELEERCLKAAETGRLRRDSRRWKSVAERNQPSPILVGDSPAMQAVFRLIERVGPTDAPVLIQGETGTGKELAARMIQRASRRADQPFVTVNCAAFSEQLIESELFGHEKGAFTGAVTSRLGLFEMADGGTLFIDEIGELPLSLQPKLLRVLEDGSYRRVGSSRELRADVRIIAATNRNLIEEVRKNHFREDLLYRINVMPITMPSLRDHVDDLPQVIRHFLPSSWEIDSDAEQLLRGYHWPGNVRQLKNILERAAILAESRTITPDDLPIDITNLPALANAGLVLSNDTNLDCIEKSHVMEVLDRCQGNKAQAARLLGIHRRKLYRLLERFGIGVSPSAHRGV